MFSSERYLETLFILFTSQNPVSQLPFLGEQSSGTSIGPNYRPLYMNSCVPPAEISA